MASTVARAIVELKKAQIRYKRYFYQRINITNAKIKVGDYIWLEVQDQKANDNLGGHSEGPFLVLDQKPAR